MSFITAFIKMQTPRKISVPKTNNNNEADAVDHFKY